MHVKNVMLDLETMGTSSTAAIIAIGAVKMNTNYNIENTFYREVHLQSSIEVGMTVDASTVIWWMQQSDKARSQFYGNKDAISIRKALEDLKAWVYSNENEETLFMLWANGPEFDNVILNNAYKLCNIEPFWSFRENRSYRELKYTFPYAGVPLGGGIQHNALNDAVWQAKHLKMIMEYQKQSKPTLLE